MRRAIITAALLFAGALPGTARADPKVLTLDGCVKVEQEVRKDHDRTTITVKCTGEVFDPEVRKPEATITGTIGNLLIPRACINGTGGWAPC